MGNSAAAMTPLLLTQEKEGATLVGIGVTSHGRQAPLVAVEQCVRARFTREEVRRPLVNADTGKRLTPRKPQLLIRGRSVNASSCHAALSSTDRA